MFSFLNIINQIKIDRNTNRKNCTYIVYNLPCHPQILLMKARQIISIATPANDPTIIANVFTLYTSMTRFACIKRTTIVTKYVFVFSFSKKKKIMF